MDMTMETGTNLSTTKISKKLEVPIWHKSSLTLEEAADHKKATDG